MASNSKKLSPLSNQPLVVVVWHDHSDIGDKAWQATEEVRALARNPVLITSAGFVLEETSEYLVIVRDTEPGNDEPEVGAPIRILKTAIKIRHQLKVPRAKLERNME